MTRYLLETYRLLPRLFIPAPLRPNSNYTRADIHADVRAGITVAIILVPQAMALALIAGLPAVYGLYAALPGFIASLWGSSRHLSTGPVAIVSFLTLTSLIPLADPGSPEFITLAAALALLVGVMQLLMGVFRLGFILHLIPHSAVVGFASAAAAIIVISQIPTLLGVPAESHEFVFQNIVSILLTLHHAAPMTLLVSGLAIGLLLVFRRLPRSFPGTLLVLLVGVVAAYTLGLEERGVALVQDIPRLLPSFTWPSISPQEFFSLLPKAAIVALVGFVEAHAIAKSVAEKTGQRLDTNQELVGQGLANIVGGMFKGYPVSGSFLRTAVNVDAGARTSIAAVVTTIITVIVLLFLSPVLSYLPRAILAAIVVLSAIQMINIRKLREIYTISSTDGIVAYVTFGMAFILKPDDAIFIGVVLALVLFIQRTVWGAQVYEMGIDRQLGVLRTLHDATDAETLPGVLIAKPGMSLYYANATHIIEQLEYLYVGRRADRGVRAVVIDFSGVNYIDVTGIEVLSHFISDAHKNDVEVAFIYARGSVEQAMHRAPHFPAATFFPNIAEMRSHYTSIASTPIHRVTEAETMAD